MILLKRHENRVLLAIVIFGLLVLIGGIRYGLTGQRFDRNLNNLSPCESRVLIAEVLENTLDDKNRNKAFVQVKYQGVTQDSLLDSNEKMLLYLHADEKLSAKDIIGVKASIQVVSRNTNPDVFDYQDYLLNRGVRFQSFVKKEDWQILLSSSNEVKIIDPKALRQHGLDILAKYLTDIDQLGVASAMILGYRNQITEEIYDAYTDTGAVHVLAVSGLHVGIVALIISFVLGFWKSNWLSAKIIKALILIACIWLYALISGGAPSVIRAATMFSLIIGAKAFKRDVNIFNTIALSAFFLLMWDPKLLFQASFQFSYLALISIVYFFPYVNRWFAPQFWLTRYIWSLLAVAISAQFLVFPLTIYYFHKFPLYFGLSGILAVPMAFLVLILGLALIFMDGIAPGIAVLVAAVLKIILHLFILGILWIQRLPMSSLDNIWVEVPSLIVLFLVILATMRYLYSKQLNWIRFSLTLVAIWLVYLNIQRYNKSQQCFITVYDVYGNYIIDITKGLNVYTIKSKDINDKNYGYITTNHRMRNRVESITDLSEYGVYEDKNIKYSPPFLQINDKIIMIPGSQIDIINHESNVDYTLITSHYSDTEIPRITHPRSKWIIDQSLNNTQSKKLMSSIDDNDINIYEIRKYGAYKINMKDE